MFSNLLGGGYFPKELPPTFSIRTFGECATKYEHTNTPLDKEDNGWWGYETHNLARAGTLRRELALVNPVAYWRLARLISSEWANLTGAAEKSPISLTKPVIGLPRGLSRGRNIPAERARVRATGKFLLNADISNFYGSVYTHTIPWALHTKEAARRMLKNKQGPPLLGDRLDSLFRAMQDGQSIGLPVGPDASLLIAEIILAAIDTSVLGSNCLNGFRFIDDYEIVFDSESEAIDVRTKLQSVLADFRLALNPLKTGIQRLPLPLDDGWSRELWRMISGKRALTKSNVIDYFDRSFELAASRPTDGVLKFALGKLSKKAFTEDAQSLAEDLVLQCGRVEAGCLPHVLVILLRKKSHRPGWPNKLGAAFNSIICDHAPQRHSSEVAWAIWGCLGFNLSVKQNAAHAVLLMEDSVCSLLLFQAHLNGLLKSPELFEPWKITLGADDLKGPRWLLTYELARLGFTLDATNANYVTRDIMFGFLYRQGVGFFDGSKIGTIPIGLQPTEEPEEEDEDEDDEEEDEDKYSEGGFWEEWEDWDDEDKTESKGMTEK